MPLADKINEIRKNRGLRVDELSNTSGIPIGTLSKITAGITLNPSVETVRAIARALSCSLDDLDDEPHANSLSLSEHSHLRKYRACDDRGRETVDYILDREYERSTGEPTQETVDLYVYAEPSAAGFGNYLMDGAYEIVPFPVSEVPRGTSFCVRIQGDSMEPDYPDGSSVYVRSQPVVESGQVGIFLLDGLGLCKQLIIDLGNRTVRLVSYNDKYNDILVMEDQELHTFGLVLGVTQKGG